MREATPLLWTPLDFSDQKMACALNILAGERTPPSFACGLRDSLLIGVLVGLAHASASGAVRLWCGMRFGWLDLPLSAAMIGLGAVMGLLVSWLVAWPFLRRQMFPGGQDDFAHARRFCFAVIALANFGLTAFMVCNQGRPAVYRLTILVMLVLQLVLWRIMRTRVSSTGNMALGLLTLSLMATGCTAWVVFMPTIVMPDKMWQFGASLVMLPLLGMGLLILRRRHPQRPRSAAALALCAAMFTAVTIASVKTPHSARSWVSLEGPSKPRQAADVPNIVLVVLDTVSSRHLDLFGYTTPTMPQLARFAREECDVAMSMTSVSACTPPAFGSILTGTWPSTHGAHPPVFNRVPGRYADPLSDELLTLPEYLHRFGYRCGAIAANYAVLSGLGFKRGFDDYDPTPGDIFLARRIGWADSVETRNWSPGRWVRNHLPEPLRRHTITFDRLRPPYRRAEEINTHADYWLRSHGDSPYFLLLNYMDAHDPYLPTSAAHTLADARPDWVGFPEKAWAEWMRRGEDAPDDLVRFLRESYDAGLRDLDRNLMTFLDRLRSRPDFDRTLLIITADHGEEFMEHHFLRHGCTPYEPAVAVPLLIRFPKSLRGRTPAVSPDFQHVDFIPTLASILNDPAAPPTEGRAWGQGRGYALSQVYPNAPHSPRIDSDSCAIRIADTKYIRYSTGREELFDLKTDPAEQRNLIEEHPDLAVVSRRAAAQRNHWPTTRRANSTHEPDAARLQSLGYLH